MKLNKLLKNNVFLKSLIIIVSVFFIGAKPQQESSQVVSSVIRELPPWWEDAKLEDPKKREDRIDLIAKAQVDVAHELTCTGKYNTSDCEVKFHGQFKNLLGLLITAGFWETRYSKRIQKGDCRKKGQKIPGGGVAAHNECDNGRARSIYQVQKNGTFPEELWENANGLDWESNRDATMAAGLSFVAAWNKCYDSHGDYGVWSAYAIGQCKTVKKGVLRARSYRKRMVTLNQKLPAIYHNAGN